jgi:cytochrome c-type biogenesis protein
MNADISYPLAFIAGLVSFLTPCVLPLVPSYVSFISGISFEDLTGTFNKARFRFITIMNSLFFISGFSFVFIVLGASSSYIGRLLFEYQDWIRIIGGIVIIIFGLFIAGFLKSGLLMRERKFHLSGKPAGYLGTFAIGMTFAAAWTPCIGPILGSILLYASSKGSAMFGLKLLSMYSLGLAVPFFISALVINTFLGFYRKLSKYMEIIMLESGLLLIGVGIILLTNQFSIMTGMISEKYPFLDNLEEYFAQFPLIIQFLSVLVITVILVIVIIILFIIVGFWLWAILDSKRRVYQKSSQKLIWLAVTIFGFIPGAALYFLVMSRKKI